MKRTFLLSLILSLLSLSLEAQTLKSKLALRTYFDQNTGEPKKTDTSFLATFDEKGNMLQSNDVEGVCYQSFEYDDLSRLIKEISFCGETSSECRSVFTGKKETKTCNNSYGNIITYSDYDDQGRILHTELVLENKVFDVDDSFSIEKIHHYYSYDQEGRMLKMESRYQDDKMYALRQWKYDAKGYLEKYTTYSENMDPDDSAVYFYDGSHRLIEFRRFSFMKKDRTYGSKFETLIKYSENNPEKTIHQTNDTLIRHHLPYTFLAFNIKPASMPASITFTSLSEDSENPWNEETELGFVYDEQHRLVSIRESVKKNKDAAKESAKEISYENTEAIMKYKAQNYMGSWVTGIIYTYENGRMKKITENTEHGFPYSELKYFYEFYE